MELINKAAVVAEIEKIYDRNRSNGYIDTCNEIDDILDFINTLKVKEMDLDFEKKELNKIEHKHAAWSEWDEDILSEIIYFFEKGIPTVQHDFRIYVSWLKSLKDRVQPK